MRERTSVVTTEKWRSAVIATEVPRSTLRRNAQWCGRFAVNVIGAFIAALFARRYVLFYLSTHRLIGVGFVVQQLWIIIAFLVRRAPRAVSRHTRDWFLAFTGTFGGVLLQPTGAHPHWGFGAGLTVQFVGLAISVVSLFALGRSFGSVAADRGMVDRGPYAIVRHPLYTGYLLIQVGYIFQSISWWNVSVVLFVTASNVGRALAEERVLATSGEYETYQRRVRWRLLPRVW
jgi:protein-S-isoprenylcysteine O-methyltransferase Ste14